REVRTRGYGQGRSWRVGKGAFPIAALDYETARTAVGIRTAGGHQIEMAIAVHIARGEGVEALTRLQRHHRTEGEAAATVSEEDLDAVAPAIGRDEVQVAICVDVHEAQTGLVGPDGCTRGAGRLRERAEAALAVAQEDVDVFSVIISARDDQVE